jgi:hypothetical protein
MFPDLRGHADKVCLATSSVSISLAVRVSIPPTVLRSSPSSNSRSMGSKMANLGSETEYNYQI